MNGRATIVLLVASMFMSASSSSQTNHCSQLQRLMHIVDYRSLADAGLAEVQIAPQTFMWRAAAKDLLPGFRNCTIYHWDGSSSITSGYSCLMDSHGSSVDALSIRAAAARLRPCFADWRKEPESLPTAKDSSITFTNGNTSISFGLRENTVAFSITKKIQK